MIFIRVYFQTRMQSLSPPSGAASRNVLEALTHMVRTEGIARPMRGMSAVVSGAAPAHALYFSVYERIKELLVSRSPTHYNHLAYGMNFQF